MIAIDFGLNALPRSLRTPRTASSADMALRRLVSFSRVSLSSSTDHPGLTCEMGLEGFVSKRLGGAYWSGRCRNWLKVKNPVFVRG